MWLNLVAYADRVVCSHTHLHLTSCCLSQFCLPKADKELYEKEENPEAQQEILKRVARNLPVYTRTGSGGKLANLQGH